MTKKGFYHASTTKRSGGRKKKPAPARSSRPSREAFATWSVTSRGIALKSSYSEEFVEVLRAWRKHAGQGKAQWDAGTHTWFFATDAATQAWLQVKILKYYGIHLAPLTGLNKPSTVITADIKLRYLGAARMRDDGRWTATGMDDVSQQWEYEVALDVLRTFFHAMPAPSAGGEKGLAYHRVLGVSPRATQAEIKKAYWQVARQWHPDSCTEKNATEMMQRINEAYRVLNNPHLKAKYLAAQAVAKKMRESGVYKEPAKAKTLSREDAELKLDRWGSWRPPLRCGLLNVTGHYRLARFVVEKINTWADITDSAGKIMVASWNSNTEGVDIEWVN